MRQYLKKLAGIAFLVMALFMNSCRQKGTVVIPVPDDTSALSKINHFIPVEQIKAYESAFNIQRDTLLKLQPGLSLPQSEAFNKQAILEILKDPACVGVRVSYGVKQTGNSNEFRLILTGVDAQGNDLYIDGVASPDNTNRAAKAPQAIQSGTSSVKGGVEQGQCTPPCQ
jgi:hypothetical protein